jgi:hypothetical protein
VRAQLAAAASTWPLALADSTGLPWSRRAQRQALTMPILPVSCASSESIDRHDVVAAVTGARIVRWRPDTLS